MTEEFQVWVMLGSAFVAVTALVAFVGNEWMRNRRLRARLADNSLADVDDAIGGNLLGQWRAKLFSVEDRIVGFDDASHRTKARTEMVRAGFFSPDAAKAYVIIRAALTVFLPVVGVFVFAPIFGAGTAAKQYFIGFFCVFLGYYGPEAYIKRRQRLLLEQYRNVFPDFLDLLVVCMDAGSSINAALERVGRDIAFQSKALGTNVQLLVSEMRSGRSLVDALSSFSARLNLDEVSYFTTLIKQSSELGADISDAMRVYSDEMREKRLSRAEQKAHALPVKMVAPLGMFIFPVILIVVLTPVFIKIVGVLEIMRRSAH
jgi:tight adherence protein C